MLHLNLPAVSERFWPAVVAVLTWALAVLGSVLWALHWPSQDLVAMPVQMPAAGTTISSAGVLRALGQSVNSETASPRLDFSLVGVIAADSGHGSALISMDGQSPRIYIQGETIESQWILYGVAGDAVTLQGPSGFQKIELKKSNQ
jgi:type II secretory pathway component PulC